MRVHWRCHVTITPRSVGRHKNEPRHSRPHNPDSVRTCRVPRAMNATAGASPRPFAGRWRYLHLALTGSVLPSSTAFCHHRLL